MICKICNPNLQGDGICAEHSSGGTSYSFIKTIAWGYTMESDGNEKPDFSLAIAILIYSIVCFLPIILLYIFTR